MMIDESKTPAATPQPKPVSIVEHALALVQQPGAADVAADVREEVALVVATGQKAGYKSSEFWLTLLIVLAGIVFAGAQLWQGKLTMEGAAIFLGAALKAATYTRGRAAEKTAAAAPPTTKA